MEKVIVLFEVKIKTGKMDNYLTMAETLKEELLKADGFISAERFSSLKTDGKLLSKSIWRDEESIAQWRNVVNHRMCQKQGRMSDFIDYQITVVAPFRTYTMNSRENAPKDSNFYFGIREE